MADCNMAPDELSIILARALAVRPCFRSAEVKKRVTMLQPRAVILLVGHPNKLMTVRTQLEGSGDAGGCRALRGNPVLVRHEDQSTTERSVCGPGCGDGDVLIVYHDWMTVTAAADRDRKS